MEHTPEYYQIIMDYRNKTNSYAIMNGIQTTLIRDGYAEAEMAVQDFQMNSIRSVHGGCLYTIADICAGSAASSYGYKVTTMNCSFCYLRAGIDCEKLIGRANVIKRGKRAIVLDVSVEDQDGTVLCTALFTFAPLDQPIEGLEDLVP